MRSLLRLLVTTGVFAVAAAPASANVECVLPVGPGGTDMRLTLTVDACPAAGEAVPREWIVGAEPVPGAVRAATAAAPGTPASTAAATAPAVRARVVHDPAPVRGVRVAYVPPAAAAPVPETGAVSAPAQAADPASSIAGDTPAATRPGDGPVPGVPTWMLAVLGSAVLIAFVAAPRTLGSRH